MINLRANMLESVTENSFNYRHVDQKSITSLFLNPCTHSIGRSISSIISRLHIDPM